MTLRDAPLAIDSLDDDATVFVSAEHPATLSSRVVVATLPEDDAAPPEAAGMRQLMDVWHMRDVLNGLLRLKHGELGRAPTQEELLNRFMSYLKNDA